MRYCLNCTGTRFLLVCYTAGFSVLTQRSSPQRKEWGSISSKRLLGGWMDSVSKFSQGLQKGASPNDQLDQLCHLNFILLLLFYSYCKFSGVEPWYNSLKIRDYSQTSISFYPWGGDYWLLNKSCLHFVTGCFIGGHSGAGHLLGGGRGWSGGHFAAESFSNLIGFGGSFSDKTPLNGGYYNKFYASRSKQ